MCCWLGGHEKRWAAALDSFQYYFNVFNLSNSWKRSLGSFPLSSRSAQGMQLSQVNVHVSIETGHPTSDIRSGTASELRAASAFSGSAIPCWSGTQTCVGSAKQANMDGSTHPSRLRPVRSQAQESCVSAEFLQGSRHLNPYPARPSVSHKSSKSGHHRCGHPGAGGWEYRPCPGTSHAAIRPEVLPCAGHISLDVAALHACIELLQGDIKAGAYATLLK